MTQPASPTRTVVLRHWHELPAPVFVLAAPRSFTSVVCAMLGQHPQLYGLPETHLFCHFHKTGKTAATLAERNEEVVQPSHPAHEHGLLRAVAQLYLGGLPKPYVQRLSLDSEEIARLARSAQTGPNVRRARRWLNLRENLKTEFMFKVLAHRLYPLVPIDKSPSSVHPDGLRVLAEKFPSARYIHLVRHPRAHAKSSLKMRQERERFGPLPDDHWLKRITSGPPGKWWYRTNTTITRFLESVPGPQQLRIRGEDLLSAPDETLCQIAIWLGVRTDAVAIAEMKHPELSPYAFVGPPGAQWGNDKFFLQDPALRPMQQETQQLNEPLPWWTDGHEFPPEVKSLASDFGYA